MPSKKSSKKGHSPGQKETGRPQNATGNAMRYPIPRVSAAAWQAIKTQRNIPLNPGLIFDRFAPDWSDKSTLKKDGLEAVRQAAERADQALLRAWNARWEAAARAACAEPFSLKTDWRLIAGLGRKGALEVGFTFHRYGFPIIPGSSVKGLARSWALIEIAQKVNAPSLKDLDEILAADGERDSKERKKYEEWREQQPEAVRMQAEDFRIIFGTTAVAGRAVFFDAIPQDKPTLDLDVMNPHFPKYYSGEEPPTDWQSPIPVYFLAVAPQTEFRFAVGWHSALDAEGVRLRKLAIDWLTQGLTELGAGGKTSAGYGYFVASLRATPAVGQLVAATLQEPTAQSLPAPLPTPQSLPEELIWRTGVVREYQPRPGRGRLVDNETNEEFRFSRDAIEDKGWSPGKKHRVRFAVVEREGKRVVVKVQRSS